MHVAPLRQLVRPMLAPSLFPSTEICSLPVLAEQPEVHGIGDQAVPPSDDTSTDPAHPSVVGLVTCTAAIAE